jgi:hypothetical protein
LVLRRQTAPSLRLIRGRELWRWFRQHLNPPFFFKPLHQGWHDALLPLGRALMLFQCMQEQCIGHLLQRPRKRAPGSCIRHTSRRRIRRYELGEFFLGKRRIYFCAIHIYLLKGLIRHPPYAHPSIRSARRVSVDFSFFLSFLWFFLFFLSFFMCRSRTTTAAAVQPLAVVPIDPKRLTSAPRVPAACAAFVYYRCYRRI